MNNIPVYSGPIIAATLAPLLGFYTLMVTHHVSRISKPLEQLIHSYGHWIPGSLGSGPLGSTGSYSGKEALALLVWLVSWAVFHSLWRKQDLSVEAWLPIFSGGLVIVSLGFIHPVVDPVIGLIRDMLGV
ncbi:MAG: hypothetical protein HOP34_07240 [Methylococcaceae bacterium]|nr:hypothetical protein [Methylococcaceae bacterium]